MVIIILMVRFSCVLYKFVYEPFDEWYRKLPRKKGKLWQSLTVSTKRLIDGTFPLTGLLERIP